VSLSEIVDATMYKQITSSLMHLTNTRPDICLAINTLSLYIVESRHDHLVAAKTCVEVPEGYNELWTQIHF
jgi:hypothetical protein